MLSGYVVTAWLFNESSGGASQTRNEKFGASGVRLDPPLFLFYVWAFSRRVSGAMGMGLIRSRHETLLSTAIKDINPICHGHMLSSSELRVSYSL